ncbi:hypothetical protein LTSEMON_2707, partial [Salmonella enterica subsp. enterica serovar Montevideo str. S5-403]
MYQHHLKTGELHDALPNMGSHHLNKTEHFYHSFGNDSNL